MYINESLCCIADINTTMQINCRATKFKEEVVRFSSRAPEVEVAASESRAPPGSAYGWGAGWGGQRPP